MKHRIYKPFPGAVDAEWVFDCAACGGLSWYQSRSEAVTFGCELRTCEGHGANGHMPACTWCGQLYRPDETYGCGCSTQGFPVVRQR